MRKWAACPICGAPDMRWEKDDEGWNVFCTNLACRSNGGKYDPLITQGDAEIAALKSQLAEAQNEVERLNAILGERNEEPPKASEMLRTIWGMGLCNEWLKEMSDPPQTYEQFLEELGGQVGMDRWEQSPEGISTLREALGVAVEAEKDG